MDDHTTAIAAGWFVGGRVGKFLEVVFVRAIAHIDFRLKVCSAFRTVLPFSRMAFPVVIRAEGDPAVIAMATFFRA